MYGLWTFVHTFRQTGRLRALPRGSALPRFSLASGATESDQFQPSVARPSSAPQTAPSAARTSGLTLIGPCCATPASRWPREHQAQRTARSRVRSRSSRHHRGLSAELAAVMSMGQAAPGCRNRRERSSAGALRIHRACSHQQFPPVPAFPVWSRGLLPGLRARRFFFCRQSGIV